MSAMRMNRQVRELVRKVEPIGWTFECWTSGGHARMVHTSGATYIIPATASDWRNEKNSIAAMERLGGQRLPRVRAGRGRVRTADADPQVEAARRRYRQKQRAIDGMREVAEAAERRRRQDAERSATDDRRRKEIEELMQS